MILLIFLLVPLLGAALTLVTSFIDNRIPRYVAISSAFICLLTSLFCYYNYNVFQGNFSTNTFMVIFYRSWFQQYGISIYLALDKLSLLMVFLTSLMGVCSIYCEWNTFEKKGVCYFFLLLILLGMFGVFLSVDMFLFFIFWEIMLIPMYFLIISRNDSVVKHHDVIRAARKFFIYSQISGMCFLWFILNIVCIYHSHYGIWTFNYFILKKLHMSFYIEFFLVCSLLLSLIIKIPLFPFHSWLPDTQEFISTSGSVDLVGILLKPAIYGLLRFYLVFFPHTSCVFSFFCVVVGLFSMFYGAIMAFSQTNIKRLLAYSSISSMGVIFAALNSNTAFLQNGVILYLFSYVISMAALLIITGKIFAHIKTQNILNMQRICSCMNFIPAFFLFFSFSVLNIPLTGNFSGEFLMLLSIFTFNPFLGCFFIFGLFFSSVYSLRMMQYICYGSKKFFIVPNELNIFDFIILILYTFLVIFTGLFPTLFLKFVYFIS
ncbi:NADH-quinone oxidoreductase subunit M [Buchnera aphidicola (Cinara splendens)]|uniref:NADH-quinone oxidoreductase subunit M n=1 Tax=Buchnera aphidicola (Cinara splendens) TaxID=2518979 RepID=A0A451DE51_9GAMM|nr:NADH-quinone oxidoreductase subunit M [Buchnera aphidicola]VFP84878.1 NADH-quinone oxidoreductase subunit M [Buchnera aphidicola (Cinara splendens)]